MSYFQIRNTQSASLAVVNLHSANNHQDELQRPLLQACPPYCAVFQLCVCVYVVQSTYLSVLSQPKRPSSFLHVLFTVTCFPGMWNVCCSTYLFLGCVFKHLFFTGVSYFQDSYHGGPSPLSGWQARTEAAPVWFIQVYIVISVCLTQTLLKSLLCLQGSKSEKKNWVYF